MRVAGLLRFRARRVCFKFKTIFSCCRAPLIYFCPVPALEFQMGWMFLKGAL
ncbi:hypothetical protein BDV40DRAFT_267855, partial [Aspergillus tamarii]